MLKSNAFDTCRRIFFNPKILLFVLTVLIIFSIQPGFEANGQTEGEIPKEGVQSKNICSKIIDLTASGKLTAISEKETHCYLFSLNGEYAIIEAIQKGVDVNLRLFKQPDSTRDSNEGGDYWIPIIPVVDTPVSDSREELISAVSQKTNKFLLAVSAAAGKPQKPDSSYSIKKLVFKPLEAGDIIFNKAEYLLLDAINLARTNKNDTEKLKSSGAQISRAKSEMPATESMSAGQKRILQNLLFAAGSGFEASPALQETAILLFNDLAELSRSLNDSFFEGSALCGLGYAYEITDLPEALKFFKKSAEAFKKSPAPDDELNAYIWAGTVAQRMGIQGTALTLYEEGGKVKNVAKLSIKANLLLNLGVVLLAQGAYDRALEVYKESEELYRKAERNEGGNFQEDKAYLYHNIARIYMGLGDITAAKDYLINRALPLSEPDGKARFYDAAAYEHLYLGRIYSDEGKYDDSEKEFRIAFGLWGEMIKRLEDETADQDQAANKYTQQANIMSNIAEIYERKGDRNKAAKLMAEALDLQDKAPNKYQKAALLAVSAKIKTDNKDFEGSDSDLKEALKLANASSAFDYQVRVLYAAAYNERAKGNLEEAILFLKQAAERIEFVRTNVKSADLRATLFANVRYIYSLYIDVLVRADAKDPGKGYAVKALEISDSARARSLSEILNRSDAVLRRRVPGSLLDKEEELQTEMAILLSQRQGLSELPKNDPEIIKLESKIGNTVESLRLTRNEIEERDPDYSRLSNPNPLAAGDIQSLLPPGAIMLEYAIGDESSYLWLVSGEEISAYPLTVNGQPVTAGKLESLVKDSLVKIQELNKNGHQSITDQSFEEYKRISRTLGEILLSPVAERIKNKRLVIAADDSLQFLPFNALPVPDLKNDWQPLIKQNEIVMIPSASALQALKKKRRELPDKYLAGFISPVYKLENDLKPESKRKPFPAANHFAKVENLSYGTGLVKRLTKTLKDAGHIDKSNFLLGLQVNRKTAVSSDLAAYRNILFYAHGVFDDTRPESSGLYLSFFNADKSAREDKFLGLADVYNLNLNADLVFLSGCETLLGKKIKGEGVTGITRGFMYAGSKSVISSLWKVPEFQTMLLVDRFFNETAVSDTGSAEALRKVQLDMWEKDKLPPYYWAAFQFNGMW